LSSRSAATGGEVIPYPPTPFIDPIEINQPADKSSGEKDVSSVAHTRFCTYISETVDIDESGGGRRLLPSNTSITVASNITKQQSCFSRS